MSVVDRLRWLLITSGGLGLAPVAPGTFGTLGGVLLAVVLQASVAPGNARFYQVQYRNPNAGFCPPEIFNFSNGYVVHW